MKYNLYKRMVCVALCAVMAASLFAACTGKKTAAIAPMEIEEAVNFSYDFIGGTDVMPIIGFMQTHKQSDESRFAAIQLSFTHNNRLLSCDTWIVALLSITHKP